MKKKRWTRRGLGGTALALAFLIHFPQASPAPVRIPAIPPLKLSLLHFP